MSSRRQATHATPRAVRSAPDPRQRWRRPMGYHGHAACVPETAAGEGIWQGVAGTQDPAPARCQGRCPCVPHTTPRTPSTRPDCQEFTLPRTPYLATAIAATLLYSATVAASQFSQVVVFGDSLSDDGNISLANDPAVQPPLRFTTNPGTVGIEHLASNLGLTLAPSLTGGTDYAWGGADDIFYHATAAGAGATAQQLIAQTIAAQITANHVPPELVAAFTAQI